MRTRTTVLSVYGPVLMAAVLILTIAPTCVMPSCTGVAVASTPGCSQPNTSRFKSACTLDGQVGSPSPQPCRDKSTDCDTTMSHGTPAAVQAQDAPASQSGLVATHANATTLLTASVNTPQVATPVFHPPDPLGVRLRV